MSLQARCSLDFQTFVIHFRRSLGTQTFQVPGRAHTAMEVGGDTGRETSGGASNATDFGSRRAQLRSKATARITDPRLEKSVVLIGPMEIGCQMN